MFYSQYVLEFPKRIFVSIGVHLRLFFLILESRMRFDQRPGVRVTGILDNIISGSHFNQLAFVNDGNSIAQVSGGGKAVGDE